MITITFDYYAPFSELKDSIQHYIDNGNNKTAIDLNLNIQHSEKYHYKRGNFRQLNEKFDYICKTFPSICFIWLSSHSDDWYDVELFKFLHKLKHLEEVYFALMKNMNHTSFNNVLYHIRSLNIRGLSVVYNHIGNYGIMNLIKYLEFRRNNHKQLKYLNLANCYSITASGYYHLANEIDKNNDIYHIILPNNETINGTDRMYQISSSIRKKYNRVMKDYNDYLNGTNVDVDPITQQYNDYYNDYGYVSEKIDPPNNLESFPKDYNEEYYRPLTEKVAEYDIIKGNYTNRDMLIPFQVLRMKKKVLRNALNLYNWNKRKMIIMNRLSYRYRMNVGM